MSNEEIKKWLQNGAGLTLEIKALRTARQTAIKYTPYSDSFIMLIDSCIRERTCEREKIIEAIDRVNDNILHAILTEKYIACHTWEQIATILNYSNVHLHHLHREALQQIKKT